MENNPQFDPLISVNEADRAQFYRKTYGHVAIAVLLFIIIESALLQVPAVVEFMLGMLQGWKWFIVLGIFILASNYADRIAHSHDRGQQYLGLLLCVVAYAFLFVPLIYIAIVMGEMNESNTLYQASITTLALFTGLSGVVLVTKKDFSFLRSIIMVGSFVALGIIIAGVIFGFNLGLVFSGGMVLLASASILYQTSNLIHKYSTDQYVGASVGLFASLMLLFWYILSIFSRD